METLQYTDAKSIGLPTLTANIPNFVANNSENSLYFIGNDTESNNHTNKTVSLIFTRLPTSPGFVHVLRCQTCNFSTLSLASIKEHIKTQHPSVDSFTTYSCAVCFASSTERALLEEHIGIYHPTLENVPQKILEKCHIISGTDPLPTTALLSTSAGTIPLTLTQTPNANGGSPGLRLQLASSSIPNHSTSARQIQSVPTYVTSQSPAPLSSSATVTSVSQSEPISSSASVNGDSAPSSLSTDYPVPVLGSRRRKAAVPGKLPVVPSSTASSGTIPGERDVSEVKRRKVESPLDPSDAVTTTAAATATATTTTTTTIAASTAIKAEVPNSITKQAILAMVNSPTGPKLALIGATAGNTSQKLCDQTATAISGMLSTHSSPSIQTSAPSSSCSGNPTISTHALSVPLMGGSSIPCGLLFAAPNGHSLSNEGSAVTGTYRAGGVLRLSDLFDAVKNSCAPQGPTTPTSANEASEKTPPPRSAASQVPTVSSLTLQYLAAPMMDVGNMTATTTAAATVACSSSSGAPSITDGLAAGKLLNQVFAAAALNPLVERQLSTSGEQALDMSIRSNCKSPESQGQQQQHSSPDITKAQSEQLTRESGDANSLEALRSALTAQIPASVAQTVPGDPPTAKTGAAETSSSSGPSSPPPPPSSTPNLLNLTTLGKQKMETPCQQQQQTTLSQAQSTPVSARQTAHLLNLAPLQTLISALANASSGGGKVDTTNGPITTSSSPHFLPPPSSVSAPLVTIDGPLGAACPISFPTALASALMPPHVTTNSLKGVTLGEYIPVGSLISGQTTGGVFNSVALNAGAPNLISFVTGLGANNNHSANAASAAARFQHNFNAGSQSFGLGFGPAGDSATPIDFNAQQALLAAAAAAATAPGSAQDLQSGATPLRLSTSTTTVATPMICALDPRNTLHLRVPESITVACSGFPTTVTAAPVKGYRLESAASLDSSMREVSNALGLDEDRRTGDFEGSALLNVDTSQRNGSLDEGADDSDEMADESCAGATNSGASASAGGDGESPVPSNDPSSTSGQNRNRRTPGSRPSGGGRRSGLGGSRPHRQNFTPTQNRILTEWYSSHQYKPYPSTDDTKMLAHKSGLTYSQVKKWFANKRARTSTSGLPKPMPPTAPDTTADTSTAAAYVAAVKAAAAAAVSTPGIGVGSGLIALPPSSSSTSVSASQSSIPPNCSAPTATVLSATNLMIRTSSHAAVNSFSGLTVLAPRPPSASCAYTLTVPTFVPETPSVEARKSECEGAFLASTTGNHEDEEQISKEEREEEEEDNNVLKNSPSPSLPSLAKVDQTAGEDAMVSSENTGAVHSPKALVSSPQSPAEEAADIGSPPALLVSSSPVPTTVPENPETSPQRERDTPSHVAPSPGSD